MSNKTFDNLKDAIAHTKDVMYQTMGTRRSFGVVCELDGVFQSMFAYNQPCWGGIRKYASDSNNCTRPDDEKPSDLDYKFPEGSPMFLLVGSTDGSLPEEHEKSQEVLDLLFSKDSPWKSGFDPDTTVYTRKNKRLFIEFNNTDIDPTTMINFINTVFSGLSVTHYSYYRNLGLTPIKSVMLTCYLGSCHFDLEYGGKPFSYQNQYYYGRTFGMKEFLEGKPTSKKESFKQGVDYNRVGLADIFSKSDGINLVKHMNKTVKQPSDIETELDKVLKGI